MESNRDLDEGDSSPQLHLKRGSLFILMVIICSDESTENMLYEKVHTVILATTLSDSDIPPSFQLLIKI